MDVLFRTPTRLIKIGEDGVPYGTPMKLNLNIVQIDEFKIQTKIVEHNGEVCYHKFTSIKEETLLDEETGEEYVARTPVMEYIPVDYMELQMPGDLVDALQEEINRLEMCMLHIMDLDYISLIEIVEPNDPPAHLIQRRVRVLKRWEQRYMEMSKKRKVTHRKKVLSKVVA